MKIKPIALSLISKVIILLLTSCPTPLSEDRLLVLQDLEAPKLLITSPTDFSEYSTVIELAGSVEDSSFGKVTEGTELSVSYSIPGTSISGSINIDPETLEFSELIDVSSLNSNKIIEISMTDRNGNKTTVTVNIVKPENGGDISGYTVTPGNRQVTISWDAVPGAESYSVSSYDKTITGITDTTYVWNELENGRIYNFTLTAYTGGIGEDAVSRTIPKMPSNKRDFAPRVKETGYKFITIEWADNENISGYTVERRTGTTGSWTEVQVVNGNEFRDLQIETDTEYYYRITPVGYDDITSESISAYAGNFGYESAGSRSTTGLARDIVISGNYIYVADDSSGLQIFEYDPVQNTCGSIVKTCDTPGTATGVEVADGYAYVTDGNEGMQIIDVDPARPATYGTIVKNCPRQYSSSDYSIDVVVRNGYAYVAAYTRGLRIYDVDPARTATFGTIVAYRDTYNAFGVDVAGDEAYIADGSDKLKIIDLSSLPTIPFPMQINLNDSARGVSIKDNYAYVVTTSGLSIVDLADTSNIYTCAIPGISGYIATGALHITFEGEYAYIAGAESGIQVIDISEPTAVDDSSLIGSYDTPDCAYAAAVSGNTVYVADERTGIQILEINKPATGSITGGNNSFNILDTGIQGDYAYLASDDSGFQVMRISDKSSPAVISSGFDTDGTASKVAIAGNYAYLADSTEGLKIIDISDPEAVTTASTTGTLDIGHSIIDLAVTGNSAYLIDDNSRMCIIDVSNPASPVLSGFYLAEHELRSVCVSGDYAYLAADWDDLLIIDITDSALPALTGVCDIAGGEAWDVAVVGDYAYIAYDIGLVPVDISDPSAPAAFDHTPGEIPRYCDTPGFVRKIDAAGDYIYAVDKYISAANIGLQVINISDPEHPLYTGNCDTPGVATEIKVAGNYAYIADEAEGLQIIDLAGN